MNGYELTERWFSFVSENSDKVDCKHTALYLYIVELFNKRQWVEVLGLPTDYTMSVLNIGSYKTYKKTFDELVQFGFIKQVEVSKNQYSSTKISLVSASVKNTKASPKHLPKQVQIIDQSTSSIIKLINIETIKLINIECITELLKEKGNYKELVRLMTDIQKSLQRKEEPVYKKFAHLSISVSENQKLIEAGYTQYEIDRTYRSIENYAKNKNYKSLYITASNWLERDFGKRTTLDNKPPAKPIHEQIEEMRQWKPQ